MARVSRPPSAVWAPIAASKVVVPRAVTVRDCLPGALASTVEPNLASLSPASISTSLPSTTAASSVTPPRPRTAFRTVSGPPVTAAVTVSVKAAPVSKRMESIWEVTRSAAMVPESTTSPAHPALPGLLVTATVAIVAASNVGAPQNHGSPDTCSEVPSWRR